jgi:hypothetical protein
VPRFASYDGTGIGYRVAGDGPPLVCLPGGPGRAAEYLGDLGGLTRWRQLILLDPGAWAHRMTRPTYFAGAEFDIPATTAALARLTAPALLGHGGGRVAEKPRRLADHGRGDQRIEVSRIQSRRWALPVD